MSNISLFTCANGFSEHICNVYNFLSFKSLFEKKKEKKYYIAGTIKRRS